MEGLKQHSGVAAPLLLDNIDTDQIIPSREMKRVSKTGLAEGLFSGQRYLYDGLNKTGPNPKFILNNSPFDRATILVSGKNFGCGSSREHAVWAIAEFGFKAVIAESFGDIFRNNCICNGIAPITLSDAAISLLVDQIATSPETNLITVDLEHSFVQAPEGQILAFTLEEYAQKMLVNGWDFIDLALRHEDEIDTFVQQDQLARPWAYL